jgi:hypothetical protein
LEFFSITNLFTFRILSLLLSALLLLRQPFRLYFALCCARFHPKRLNNFIMGRNASHFKHRFTSLVFLSLLPRFLLGFDSINKHTHDRFASHRIGIVSISNNKSSERETSSSPSQASLGEGNPSTLPISCCLFIFELHTLRA